ncbi:YqjF family protein [Kineosporia sp. R_H_3]|uniref:YqjF family protein n=1 Tax=Kineosporia sp. R_H_3 TaxID=1961848 RepID=UPI000B4BA526|nr:DUF2071 domain-containing protein [Kineosporia sp. R_H_3]
MTSEVEPVTPTAPRPVGRTVFTQRWAHLTFLHWAVEPDVVAPLLLPGLRPDTIDGLTYVALVPFVMQDIGLLGAPRMPYVGDFCETNVRLYSVDGQGRRGVVFRSLDASRTAPVLVARWGPGLPYVWSRMRFSARPSAAGGPATPPTDGAARLPRTAYAPGTVLSYTSSRRWPAGGPPEPAHPASTVRVRVGDPVTAGPLEHFLTARWGLHLADRRGRTRYWPNEHPQWPLHAAQVVHLEDQVLEAAGFPGLAGRPPDSVLHSPGVDVRFGPVLP